MLINLLNCNLSSMQIPLTTVFLTLCILSSAGSAPVDSNDGPDQMHKKQLKSAKNQSSSEAHSEDTPILNVLWTTIKRQPNRTDLIRPSLCPSPCDRLFKARRVEHPVLGIDDPPPIDEELCYCRCPDDASVFLQSVGQCVAKIDDCKHPIRVVHASDNPNVQWTPVVVLPKEKNFIRFPGRILWKDISRVKLDQMRRPRCNITKVLLLRQERQWLDASNDLFLLGWSKELDVASLIWNGSEDDREELLGAIVQIQMNCNGAEPNSHCLSLRASGELIYPNYLHQSFANADDHKRIETVVIILLAILLFFTSFGYLILWKIRWRIKKSKLISTLQMQFLYHMKQEKEKVNEIAHNHHYQVFANTSDPPIYHQQKSTLSPADDTTIESRSEIVINGEQQTQNATLIAKRKLYFSAEFFEPHLMQNPPPVADQFLLDLRKMIDIAKQRINLRKHVQHLGPIAEEPPEVYQPYMRKCMPVSREPLSVINSANLHLSASTNKQQKSGESSAKTIKLIDLSKKLKTSSEPTSDRIEVSSDENVRPNAESVQTDSQTAWSIRDSTNNQIASTNDLPYSDRLSSLQSSQNSQHVSSIQHEFKKLFDPSLENKLTSQLRTSSPQTSNSAQLQNGSVSLTSRIPIMSSVSLGQKSPRFTSKPLTLTNQPSITINSTQQCSPGVRQESPELSEVPPPLPPRNPPAHPSKLIQQFMTQAGRVQQNGSSTVTSNHNGDLANLARHQASVESPSQKTGPLQSSATTSKVTDMRRKAYAVFPQNEMLKKSLPRRSKKPSSNKPVNTSSSSTTNRNGLIETNM